ncbi:MAG: hypothetical protein HRU69_14705 [Flammeovirgaceae bacterium]|nr:MAG: hypothetical protein HRU69_14705 [Flammeovirgaceae bacterium]
MKRQVLLIFFGLIHSVNAFSQCAMCRSTLENNISNGNVGIAAGINTGILYLLSLPYLAVMVLGYLWYKNSRRRIA